MIHSLLVSDDGVDNRLACGDVADTGTGEDWMGIDIWRFETGFAGMRPKGDVATGDSLCEAIVSIYSLNVCCVLGEKVTAFRRFAASTITKRVAQTSLSKCRRKLAQEC